MPEDPIQIDRRIKKGAVVVNERGQLFVALARFYRTVDRTPNGWHGMGFNGQRVKAEIPEFVAPSINVYISDTYGQTNSSVEVSIEEDNP